MKNKIIEILWKILTLILSFCIIIIISYLFLVGIANSKEIKYCIKDDYIELCDCVKNEKKCDKNEIIILNNK